MKILILQDRLRSGGTERQSVLLSNAFSESGHKTELITFRPGGALADTVAKTVERRVLQPFDLGLDWFAPGLIRHARHAAPDIVLCMGRMANCHAGRLQKSLPDTVVLSTMRTGKTLPFLFRRSLGLVRAIVANSHEAKQTLASQYGVADQKISVIHNSLVFRPAPAGDIRERLRSEQGATANTFVLLCVAMFRPEKNQRELIEIAAQLPATLDWQLWLAGDGEARTACEHLARHKALSSRVKFLGWQRDPTPFYASADVAVHASWSEALSNFLIEAQASGLPVVAYKAQGIAESCIPGNTGYILPRDDRAAFCAKIIELATANEAERIARSSRAQTYARETFDHDRQVGRYLALFDQLTR